MSLQKCLILIPKWCNPYSWEVMTLTLLHHAHSRFLLSANIKIHQSVTDESSNSHHPFLSWKTLSLFVPPWNSTKISEKLWSLFKFSFYSLPPCVAQSMGLSVGVYHLKTLTSVNIECWDRCQPSAGISAYCCVATSPSQALHARVDILPLWGLLGAFGQLEWKIDGWCFLLNCQHFMLPWTFCVHVQCAKRYLPSGRGKNMKARKTEL